MTSWSYLGMAGSVNLVPLRNRIDRSVFPRRAPAEVFWGEYAPFDHAVQLYANDESFLDALEGFVSGGLRVEEGVIVIASPLHRRALESRLRRRGFDLELACQQERFIAVDAEATLAQFMVEGWPDEARFIEAVKDLISRAQGNDRRVRAFGEMVAVLWQQGNRSATIHLEHLWNQLCAEGGFRLFCAYPETSLTQDTPGAVGEICAQHSRVIAW